MGQAVASAVLQSNDLELVIATVRDTCEQTGNKVANSDITITTKILSNDFDIMIDFTLPEGVMEHLDYCRTNKKAMVIGATGFTPEQLETINAAAREIPILMSSNMSVGVNIFYKLLSNASQMLRDDWDVSILDLHHQHKKDAPSGTAKQLAKIVSDNTGKNLTDIQIESHRKGDIVGTHIVTFKNPVEFITIAHEAQDRGIFAQGAVVAAHWLSNRGPGLYSMQDVI